MKRETQLWVPNRQAGRHTCRMRVHAGVICVCVCLSVCVLSTVGASLGCFLPISLYGVLVPSFSHPWCVPPSPLSQMIAPTGPPYDFDKLAGGDSPFDALFGEEVLMMLGTAVSGNVSRVQFAV